MAGYSATPLAKKLGIKPGFVILLVNAPDYYFNLFTDFPADVTLSQCKTGIDFIHCFVSQRDELTNEIPRLKKQLRPNGMIWISWYKKSSKIPTDVTEDIIRAEAIKNGLVDIKVCAVNELWSGLKLVIPVKDR